MINLKNSLILLPTLALMACGGEEQSLNEPTQPGSVTYSYPTDGQGEVSPVADVVLRFSHAITTKNDELAKRIEVSANGGGAVDFNITRVDGGRSLVLSTGGQLDTGTDYTVTFNKPLQAEGGRAVPVPNAFGDPGIQFTTRAAAGTGVHSLASLSDTFEVVGAKPSANGLLKPMDFSTFRLRTSQPIHPDSVTYGETVSLTDADGNLVPADVLASGRNLTIDPCTTDKAADCGSTADELNAGEQYTLTVNGLLNQKGDSIKTFEQSFRPIETGPTEVLFQETVDSNFEQRSILNGQFVNAVTLNSVLQGTAGPSQQTGALYAELAYGPNFPGDNPVPLRIPRNTLLTSTSLDVKIGGVVPLLDEDKGVIEKTGQIGVTMVSDASGYLYPNPYSDSVEAPRHVRLFMDVAMNTEEDQPNASLSQDLQRVQLTGIAKVRDGILQIDAIGIVEPNLLGQEVTDSTIAFQIKADTGAQDTAPPRPEDATGPKLVSWMPGPDSALPGDRDQMQRPGDPIVLNFNEPLDGDSIAEGFTLHADGVEVTRISHSLDGTTLALNPAGGLKHGVNYELTLNNTLTDLAGNGVMSQTLSFALPEIRNGNEAEFASPLPLTTYPGFPCVSENLDLPNGSHGTCVDAAPEDTVRDQLPVTTLPENRSIVVQFSQSMDPDTINPDSFVVEKIADPANPASVGNAERVTGRLELNKQRIRFHPNEAWVPGKMYRYTLRSAQDGDCSTGELICSDSGKPLQTDLLVDPADVGGPDLSIYFTGKESVESVFTPLRNLPVRDTNSNYVIDCPTAGGTDCLEPFSHEKDGNGGFLPSANASKLRVIDSDGDGVGDSSAGDARVGCSPDGGEETDCPKKKFIYQTYALDTEVIGPKLDEDGNKVGVRVLLYPTQLATTSATVFVSANLLLGSDIESTTGTQILRMTYGEPSEDNPLGLVEGVIKEGPDGHPIFEAVANLTLDAPNLDGVDSHDVYSKPLQLKLSGNIVFFDDGRMQIEQRNVEAEDVTVNATAFGTSVTLPLQIPTSGVYLNFLSNPIKDLIAPPEGS